MKGLPGSEKPWVKIDPKGTDPLSKMFAGLTGDMGDPRQLADNLEGLANIDKIVSQLVYSDRLSEALIDAAA